jgi:hypothetical protein
MSASVKREREDDDFGSQQPSPCPILFGGATFSTHSTSPTAARGGALERLRAAVAADPPLKREQEYRADEEARKRFKTSEYNDLVSVLIGPEEAPFTVHEHFICAKSKLLKNACSETRTGETGSSHRFFRLPNTDPRIFRYYLKWVYTSDVVIEIEHDPRDPEGKWRRAVELDRLIKLYVLGHVLDDLRLSNRVLRTMLAINERPFAQSITWAYEHTPTTSNLRGVLVRLACYRWNRAAVIKSCASYHHEFVRALVVQLMLETKESLMLPHPLPMLPDHLEDESNA